VKFVLLLAFFVSGCVSHDPAPYLEVTGEYELPPEMKGCKIYVLGGGWSSKHPVWAIVSPKGEIIPSPPYVQ
jgi:hypothetical protein